MISKIKDNLESKKGKNLHFKFNGARNQIEEFNGKIIKLYPSIFIVSLVGDNDTIKSFSYSDLITESVEIISWRITCKILINFLQLEKR